MQYYVLMEQYSPLYYGFLGAQRYVLRLGVYYVFKLGPSHLYPS